MDGQRGLAVKRPPGDQEVRGSNRTPLQPCREKRNIMDIWKASLDICAPMVLRPIVEEQYSLKAEQNKKERKLNK